VSSKIDHESGVVTITGCGYTWAAPGHRLYVEQSYAVRSARAQRFEDYLARLALSRPSNGVRMNEVRVRPPDGALLEALTRGELHESLIEEQRAA
jgi:hypothetical protein